MVEKFLAGSAALFGDPITIAIFVFGVIGGMLFGAIPGVSMLTLAAILLPFTADLDPAQGVMLFAVIYCTGTYGARSPQSCSIFRARRKTRRPLLTAIR